MNRYRKCFAYLLCSALLASGCGGSRSGNGSNSNGGDAEDKKLVRAVELVTQEDAAKILGVPVRLEGNDLSKTTSSCFYAGQNFAEGNPSHLSANILVLKTEAEAHSTFESSTNQARRMGPIEPIIDLGGEALLVRGNPASLSIFVRKNKTMMTVIAYGNTIQRPSLPELKNVVKRAVEQL